MFKKIFRHTFFYGLATALPRLLTFLLTPLYVSFLPSESDFGLYAGLMIYMIFGNVILSYGMETTYFRFVNKFSNRKVVERTALTSILLTTIGFVILGALFYKPIADQLHYKPIYLLDVIIIMAVDALVVIPFAWLRDNEYSLRYTIIKVVNIIINIVLNILFLVILRDQGYWFEDSIHWIFIAMLIPSTLTLLMLLPVYQKIGLGLDKTLWRKMLSYGYPILIAGIAFAINEGIDRLMLRYLLPKSIADGQVGIYAACYKLGAFMALFTTAFKLGIEPFFFRQAKRSDATHIYGKITYYFVIFGSIILLVVSVYIDILKYIIVPNKNYWEGLWIVPIILLANLFLGIYHNLSVWYKVRDKTIFGALFSIVGAVVTLSLNIILIPILGYKGSAIATVSAYGLMMLSSYLVGYRHYKIRYPIGKILVVLLSAFVLSFLSFYIFESNIYIGSSFIVLFAVELILIEKLFPFTKTFSS